MRFCVELFWEGQGGGVYNLFRIFVANCMQVLTTVEEFISWN